MRAEPQVANKAMDAMAGLRTPHRFITFPSSTAPKPVATRKDVRQYWTTERSHWYSAVRALPRIPKAYTMKMPAPTAVPSAPATTIHQVLLRVAVTL
jgi:hypothetical protein